MSFSGECGMFLAVVQLVVLCVLQSSTAAAADGQRLNEGNTLLWGPGLMNARLSFPVRYFFIQAVDDVGRNITSSLGADAFELTIANADTKLATRTWAQILDRNDGSYIVRYKMIEGYRNIIISVQHNGQHVSKSPYYIKGPIFQEKCYCPIQKLSKWLELMNCPSGYRQIQDDLSVFSMIDMKTVSKEIVQKFNQRGRHSLCHYVIKNNMIYRKTYGEHVGFKMFMDAILLSLARKVVLPDLEFFVNLGDWPLVQKAMVPHLQQPLPILSWCASDESYDIVMPTYDITESTLETMGRVSLDMLAVQANTGPKWSNKSSMAFWRGRDSRQERLDLVKLSRQHPDVIDAKLTNMFFFKHTEDLGDIVKHISFYDFFKHKYQLNIDGTVAAYRFPYLMGGSSVIIKQDSNYYEHFYKDLKPYQHYIPMKHDLSDVMQQIQWAKDNDSQAEQIARNAQTYVRENLLAKDIFCYHAILLQEYSKLLSNSPTILGDMELVEQPSDRESECDCHRLKTKRDEL